MSEKRVVRRYETTFKIDAAKLVEERGYTIPEAAERLGIPKANLTRWLRQYREGRLAPEFKQARPTPEESEVRSLKAEIKRLELENEILKKASAFFARNQR